MKAVKKVVASIQGEDCLANQSDLILPSHWIKKLLSNDIAAGFCQLIFDLHWAVERAQHCSNQACAPRYLFTLAQL